MSLVENLPEYYMITGITTEQHSARPGRRVYFSVDTHSGGYPYWSTLFQSAERLYDIEEAIRSYKEAKKGYMADQATSIMLVMARTSLHAVSDTEIEQTQKEAALNKLTAEERRLLGL
jgi:hypothetical protein